MKKVLFLLCVLVSICLIALGGYKLYQYWSENAKSKEIYTGLQDFIRFPEPTRSPHASPVIGEKDAPSGVDEPPADPYTWPEVDFESLLQVNPDIVGWLYCEGTDINYPVVQGDDNAYYLTHLFDRSYNANGCLFLDCRVAGDFSEKHSIIYGHHMQSGAMFASLDGYKSQEYFDAHPVVLLVTPERNYVVELFAGYVAVVEDRAWEVLFDSEISYSQWLMASREQSFFESPISPASDTRVLTLSTCSYEFSNARFVVLGRLSTIAVD